MIEAMRPYRACIAMRPLEPRLPAWERQHRTEIDAIRAAWKQRVAQARPAAHDLLRRLPNVAPAIQ